VSHPLQGRIIKAPLTPDSVQEIFTVNSGSSRNKAGHGAVNNLP
jgi:hypothetical protein